MNSPQTPTTNPSNPSLTSDPLPIPGYNSHAGLSSSEVSKMVDWVKDDLLKGRIGQAQADAQFVELNVPIDQRGVQPDQRSSEQQQLDAPFLPRPQRSI